MLEFPKVRIDEISASGMKFSWRARRRSQATRLVTIRVNWPAVVGPEWVQPCGYAHTSARRWRGSLLRSVLLHSNVVQLFAAKFRVPLKCHGDALRGYALQTPDAFEKARSLSSPSPLPSFSHTVFRFGARAAASKNRQGVTPRTRPALPPLHNRTGKTKESLELGPSSGQSKFFGDPNAPWRKSGGGGKKRKRIWATNAPIHRVIQTLKRPDRRDRYSRDARIPDGSWAFTREISGSFFGLTISFFFSVLFLPILSFSFLLESPIDR